jgi:hypothetical protein
LNKRNILDVDEEDACFKQNNGKAKNKTHVAKRKRKHTMNIKYVARKYEKQLMSLPYVTGIDIEKKEGKGVIKVFVMQKIALSALQPEEIVPKSLDGYTTDVEGISLTMARSVY